MRLILLRLFDDLSNRWFTDKHYQDSNTFGQTRLDDGTTIIEGNWIQIDIGQEVIVDRFDIYSGNYTYDEVKEGDVLTSLTGEDGIWKSIYQIRTTVYRGVGWQSFYIEEANQIPGRYYRLAIKYSHDPTTSGNASRRVAVKEWTLFSSINLNTLYGNNHKGNAFNGISSDIVSLDGSYNNSDHVNAGEYTGSISTTVDGSDVKGVWIQIDMGNLYAVTQISINYMNQDSELKDAILVGSVNGTDWFAIYTINNQEKTQGNVDYNILSQDTIIAQYYRLIITKNHGGVNGVYLRDLKLSGYTQTEYESMLKQQPGLKIYMNTGRDISITSGFDFEIIELVSEDTHQEILTAMKREILKSDKIVDIEELFTSDSNRIDLAIPNQSISGEIMSQSQWHGRINYSSFYDENPNVNFEGYNAFDQSSDTAWRSEDAYQNVMSYTTTLDDGSSLLGNWIQIDIGENVILLDTSIHTYSDYGSPYGKT